MPIDFKLPSLGENIDAGDIVSVLVHEGDEIKANQNVFEVETGKATVELPCPHAGKITKIHVRQGQNVPVGDVLLSIEAAAGASASAKPAAAPPAAKPAPAPEPKAAAAAPAPQTPAAQQPATAPAAPVTAPAPVSPNGGAAAATAVMAPAGPATRRLARELGVDLSRVSGTGPSGRITEEDVKKAVRESTAFAPAQAKKTVTVPNAAPGQDQWGTLQIQPLSRIRKTIAVNMARSASTIPHVTNFDDADITELDRIRKGGMASTVSPDVKLTMLPFVMKAVAHALQLHPVINASLDMERDQVVYKDYVNIGVAVDTDRGLVVPVVRDVDRLTIPQLAQALAEISTKARNNQFGLEDMRGGTFTISNLGAIGGAYSTPIINHPEVAILLVGRSRQQPVIVDDEIKVRLMMPLSISYDHRLIDGAAAARFLNEVKNFLQVPGRLLLAN
ncbi:MAG TPA: 2-oxo acid dehydrogenase subunit E2 [Pirellulales bacterium]|nr:2-oxo acid dehydrogenase subunit E2 [Pirellulales bacterium]